MNEETIKNLLYKLRHRDVDMTFPQVFKYLSDNSEGYLQELFWILEEKTHSYVPVTDVIDDYHAQKEDLEVCDEIVRNIHKKLEQFLDEISVWKGIKNTQIKNLEKLISCND